MDQESGAEERTGRQWLGSRQDSETGRDQRTGRFVSELGFESRESSVKIKRQYGRDCLERED